MSEQSVGIYLVQHEIIYFPINESIKATEILHRFSAQFEKKFFSKILDKIFQKRKYKNGKQKSFYHLIIKFCIRNPLAYVKKFFQVYLYNSNKTLYTTF